MGQILSSEGLFPSFLGLVTYCGKFIPNFATITEPLTWLARQKADFVWNGKRESAFSKIKTFIFKAPVLSYFHAAFETKIVADTSKQGLGAVLPQKNPENGVFQPVVFASRSLSDAQTRYSQTEREALEVLAAVFSREQFKNYVRGLRFMVPICGNDRSETAS